MTCERTDVGVPALRACDVVVPSARGLMEGVVVPATRERVEVGVLVRLLQTSWEDAVVSFGTWESGLLPEPFLQWKNRATSGLPSTASCWA